MKDCMDKLNKNRLLSLKVLIGALNTSQAFTLDSAQASKSKPP
jgi:hypothetical protein